MPGGVKIRTDENSDADTTNGSRCLVRILVAEDDDDLRHITTALLSGAGYEVDEAQDGFEAWQALERSTYDLILTDHNMPRMTGIDLLARLRASQIKTPVILVTGQIPTDELSRHPSLQIEAIILKPYTAVGLLAMVENILSDSDLDVPDTSKLKQRPGESFPNFSKTDPAQ